MKLDIMQVFGAGTIILSAAATFLPPSALVRWAAGGFILVMLGYGLYAAAMATTAHLHLPKRAAMTLPQRKAAGSPVLMWGILAVFLLAVGLLAYGCTLLFKA